MSLDKLKQTITELMKNNIPVQTVWVEVSEVDWEERTMTAIGIDDEVEYFDVLLGLGSLDMKPKEGSNCLIGIIENSNTVSFLIVADEIEEFEINVEDCQLNINEGFLLKKENETLKKLMSDLIKAIKAMKFQTNTGVTIQLLNLQDFIDVETRFNQFLK